MKRTSFVAMTLIAFATSACADTPERDLPRNPFGIRLQPDPAGEDVAEFARQVRLPGDSRDANAAQWVVRAMDGKAEVLDGQWSGRWNYDRVGAPWVNETKATLIATKGDHVFILFTYYEGDYLIVAKRDGKDRLAGRSVGVQNPRDLGLFVGRIVNGERIDGEWTGPSGHGRWDFRRKLESSVVRR